MKRVFIIVLFLSLAGSGCQNTKSRAVEGAVIGGVLGAAAGGIIGHQSRSGGEGAGIGAAVGVLTGALIGSQIEKPGSQTVGNSQNLSVPPVRGQQTASPNQMSVQQIADLSSQGVHEAVIIDKIRLTGSRFILAASDISDLKAKGVSLKVIDAMQGIYNGADF